MCKGVVTCNELFIGGRKGRISFTNGELSSKIPPSTAFLFEASFGEDGWSFTRTVSCKSLARYLNPLRSLQFVERGASIASNFMNFPFSWC